MVIIALVIALAAFYAVLAAKSELSDEPTESAGSDNPIYVWVKKKIADKDKGSKILGHLLVPNLSDWIVASILGIVMGICTYYSKSSIGVAIAVLVVAFIIVFYIVRWWMVEGSELSEMKWFIAILLLLNFIISRGVTTIVGKGSQWWVPLLKSVPFVALIVPLAIIFYNYFSFRETVVDEDKRSFHKCGKKVVVIAAIILLCCVGAKPVFGTVKDFLNPNETYAVDEEPADEGNKSEEKGDPGDKPSEEEPSVKEIKYLECVHFRNSDLQDDDDETNDYNLGYDHWKKGRSVDYYVSDRKTAYSGENGKKIDTLVLAQMLLNYKKYLKQKNVEDLLYICSDGKELKALGTADAVAQALSTNQELLDKAIALVDSTQARATSRVEKLELRDQVYVQPESFLGRPKLVVYQSDVKSDWCLIDTFVIKGKKIEIAYRIRCGYQTCNVAKTYGLGKVPKKPNKPSKPGKPGKGGNDKPKPKPKDKPKKDQSKRSALPNDKKGPGKNTIDPKDYEHSSEDTGDSTTSTTPEQYHNDNKDKGDAGKNQNTGGGSTDPSTDTGGTKDNHGSDADRKTDTSGGTAAGKDSDGKVDEPS